jgi:hypothetical protein
MIRRVKPESIPLEQHRTDRERRLAKERISTGQCGAEHLRRLGRASEHDAGPQVEKDARRHAWADGRLRRVGGIVEVAGILGKRANADGLRREPDRPQRGAPGLNLVDEDEQARRRGLNEERPGRGVGGR